MLDGELMNSKWERSVALITGGPGKCSIRILPPFQINLSACWFSVLLLLLLCYLEL